MEGDVNIRRAIDFLTSPEMLAAGHAENLTRLHDELIHKDWFQTLPDFNAYVVRKGRPSAITPATRRAGGANVW